MEEDVLNRIALNLLEEGERLFAAFAFELDDGLTTRDRDKHFGEFPSVDGELHRIGVLAIENRRNLISSAQATGGRTASFFALRNFEYRRCRHNFVPPVTPGLRAGVVEKRTNA